MEKKGVAKQRTIRLGAIGYARSGDKGSSANIGVIARTPECYRVLVEQLTAARVAEFFLAVGIVTGFAA